ncbi:AAA family ATPase [Lentzea sp. NPDC058450]|uniref:AAA family ATPase n=1 Tax=Lentzea sp. NPDC058450 TaxID=3346505 RepID=UPI0036655202
MEQRKLVTVLFCDLVGSTELSGILEPELLRSVVLRYFDTARERIEGHGGTVEKFIGDAVMAVFGVPVVHEDDARRGTAAALDIIAGLDELNIDLEESFGCRLAVRIGVNTGEVVATSAVGANENLVAGEVVNVAARLEQNAGPGQVLIGPVTRALLGSAADVEEVGALALKGKRDPVTAYRVHAVQTHADRTLPSDVPFVGRTAELALLADRWAEVLDGRGRHLTISGEAGIGKTRLIREWLPANAFVGAGRCHPYRDQASLAPLAQALQGILDAAEVRSGEAQEGVTGTGPTHQDARGGASGIGPSPALQVLRSGLLKDGAPGLSADATFHAVATVLTDLATKHPVVLVIDDLQWADRTLLDAVTHLAEALKATRVMLVCAGRGLTDAAVTLHVTPLTPDESARLAAELVPVQAHGPSVLDRVIDRAEGNPLYLEQLVAMLEDGADPDTLPVTVTAVLAARIDALEAPDRVVLDAAAVVGRQFAAREAATLAESDASVGELMRRGLVEPVAALDYRFHSGLLRDVTYNGISKRRRADWHEQLASQDATGHHLEQAYLHRHGLGMRDAHTSDLRSQAARVLAGAARTALDRADLSWAENLGSRALALSKNEDPWWAQAAQVVAETRIATGHDATELLNQIIDNGDATAVAHARLQLSARPAERAETARHTLATFESTGDHLGQARCLIRIAQDQQLRGAHADAEKLLTTALHHAEAAPEQAVALGALGISLWHGPVPAPEAARRCRALLAEHDHDVVALTLSYPLANLLALQGEDAEAQQRLNAADRFARELGYAEAAIVGPLFAAGVEALAGRLDNAERLLRDTLSRATGIPDLIATTNRELARVLLGQGKPAEFTPADDLATPEAADQLGIQALIANDPELAREAVARAVTTESPITQAIAYLDLATVSGDEQAAERAEELFRGKGHVVGERRAARLRKAVR